ncbi:MAG: hypothetical protein M1827_006499 [Pycnora praestabilis]|nr:MAG: hypothetical protein M1827_006499 [Pycnora praestabilis]
MYSIIVVAALLSPAAFASPPQEKRQATSTNGAQFSSAANQLISLYLPESVLLPIGVAVQSAASAASVTGDINSIVESALLAPTPPPYLSAVPAQYQSNIAALESAINSLRLIASVGSISGAPYIITTTDSAGSTFATTSIPPANYTATPVILTTTASGGSTYTTTFTSSGPVNGTVETIFYLNGTDVTSTIGVAGGITFITTTISGNAIVTTLPSTTPTPSSTPASTSGDMSSGGSAATGTATAGSTSKKNAGPVVTAPAAAVLGLVGLLAAI